MPIKRELYPDNWEEISLSIKIKAKWTCQHCGKPCRQPHLKLKDVEEWLNSHHQEWIDSLFTTDKFGEVISKPNRFTLTTAHLDHNPANCHSSNLKALCTVCHLRYDMEHHVMARKINIMKNRELRGQMTLDLKLYCSD